MKKTIAILLAAGVFAAPAHGQISSPREARYCAAVAKAAVTIAEQRPNVSRQSARLAAKTELEEPHLSHVLQLVDDIYAGRVRPAASGPGRYGPVFDYAATYCETHMLENIR